jgi:hypothetical protein
LTGLGGLPRPIDVPRRESAARFYIRRALDWDCPWRGFLKVSGGQWSVVCGLWSVVCGL